jgi:hypothetical protein
MSFFGGGTQTSVKSLVPKFARKPQKEAFKSFTEEFFGPEGQPLITGAQDVTRQHLTGGFLDPNNPALQGYISALARQADASRNILRSRLQAQGGLAFSTPGIRLEQQQIDQPLQDQIAGLYLQNYLQGIQNQMAAAQMAPEIANARYQLLQNYINNLAGNRQVVQTQAGPGWGQFLAQGLGSTAAAFI